jgi:ketosteroid isomerase-like protein
VSDRAKTIVDEFLAAQREMYAGGSVEPVSALMADDVVWHVPGTSPVAGDYRGKQAALDYFRARREMAGGRIEITKHGELIGDDVVVQLADGHARLGSGEVRWRTAGVYRLAEQKIVEAWLVPLEADAFDEAWALTRTEPFVYEHRFRLQERLIDVFEAAFVDYRRARREQATPQHRITLANISIDYLVPVAADDDLSVRVHVDRQTAGGMQLFYEATVAGRTVARARARYERDA